MADLRLDKLKKTEEMSRKQGEGPRYWLKEAFSQFMFELFDQGEDCGVVWRWDFA